MAMCLVSAVGFKGNQTCYAFLLFGVEAGVINLNKSLSKPLLASFLLPVLKSIHGFNHALC